VGDILEPDFRVRYEKLRNRHLDTLDKLEFHYDFKEREDKFFEAVEVTRGFKIASTEYLINTHLSNGDSILAEGAQGSLLDIDFGSFPFVTSSNTVTAGACTGLGVAPSRIGEVFGIFKAYCTRVGSGPFPTELLDEMGENLRQRGNEFGATTGRPRRCGWLDIPALNYAAMINGVTQLFMMKVDVLADLEAIEICTGYQQGNRRTDQMPLYFDESWKPITKSFRGWKAGVFDTFDIFPEELSTYIDFIERETGIPINLISTGPDRKQTIIKDEIPV
jgi:adenylosuccinate synthase